MQWKAAGHAKNNENMTYNLEMTSSPHVYPSQEEDQRDVWDSK